MNPMDPPGGPRVVLVTGSAGLLGAAAADAFWQDGWRVFAGWHVRPPGTRPGRWIPLALDVTSTAAVDRALDELAARAGRLDVVVNTVGMVRDAVLPRLDVEDWREVVEVNLAGARRVLAGAARLMLRRSPEGGHLIQVGSQAGRSGGAGQAAYAAAKAGLVGLVQSLAREVAAENLRVNLVWPGVMAGPMTRGLAPEALARLARANLLGRLNDPVEVARFLRHLAGMRNVSGQVFNLDSRPVPWA